VDYCSGLKRFGISEQESIRLILTTPKFITVTNTPPRVATIDCNKLGEILSTIPLTRPKSTDVAEFNTELSQMWFVILYFAAFDPNRPRGGPLVVRHAFFDERQPTIKTAISANCGKTIVYTEEFP